MSPAAIIHEMLRLVPHKERAAVLRHLQILTADELKPSPRIRMARRWLTRLLAVVCLILIAWTSRLWFTLPRHYVAGNWNLAWTGFDVGLLGCFSITAWALWKQRQIVVTASMITSVLLLCDAWFDISTAHGHDRAVSVALAVFAELPMAALLGVLSVRLIHASMRLARGIEPNAPVQAMWRTELFPVARTRSNDKTDSSLATASRRWSTVGTSEHSRYP
jgi:hypothetical protein